MFIRCPEPGASPPGAVQLSHPALESSHHRDRHKYGAKAAPYVMPEGHQAARSNCYHRKPNFSWESFGMVQR
jgi:hypothetical protein